MLMKDEVYNAWYELKTILSACTQSVRELALCVENGQNEYQRMCQSHFQGIELIISAIATT